MNRLDDQLDERICDFYELQRLDAGTRERLKAVVASAKRPRPWSARGRLASVIAVAAVVILAVGVSSVFSGRRAAELADRIAGEIALNHNKLLQPEVFTGSFAQLRGGLPLLDFELVKPRRAGVAELRLVGGRYCSVTEVIAAQIRLTDERGTAYTLYEFRAGRAFASIEETQLDVDGVRVTLWREGGIVMGLAEPRP